ncbi:hypothetical protein IC229_33590 [Spirosoma sp. BT702]|uniref:Uncharacterized protein n=1 Tax=Spirosoma profusum TaxID=2771354 RepID=A0A927AW82_9BACT|nr:hypothetical protein [Spirosoma profusum]MBD2705590.1 hypothetical protein [Spirosoma profusum]
MKLRRYKRHWWVLEAFGIHFTLQWIPLKALKRYRELGQQIVWARDDKQKQLHLIAERSQIGNAYDIDPCAEKMDAVAEQARINESLNRQTNRT